MPKRKGHHHKVKHRHVKHHKKPGVGHLITGMKLGGSRKPKL
jgi:hypothetical protein